MANQYSNIKIEKRTFEAKNYPKDSFQRKQLNSDVTTSEYVDTRKYVVKYDVKADNKIYRSTEFDSFETKAEAEVFAEKLSKKKGIFN